MEIKRRVGMQGVGLKKDKITTACTFANASMRAVHGSSNMDVSYY